jgi:hypothetical protein
MPKVVPFRGASPSGWSKDRWVWRKAIIKDDRLSMAARVVGSELAFGFANSETAECNPGVKVLMDALASSRSTIMRALAELTEWGWIIRLGGEGPGKRASYRFAHPERVSDLTPERVSIPAPERVSDLDATCVKSENPPIPPYKDQLNMNHNSLHRAACQVVVKGGQRPRIATEFVEVGTLKAEWWNDWLAANSYPSLEKIGLAGQQYGLGGWEMPITIPAGFEDQMPQRIAVSWADWLNNRA